MLFDVQQQQPGDNQSHSLRFQTEAQRYFQLQLKDSTSVEIDEKLIVTLGDTPLVCNIT